MSVKKKLVISIALVLLNLYRPTLLSLVTLTSSFLSFL
jgi:hypothetical protein